MKAGYRWAPYSGLSQWRNRPFSIGGRFLFERGNTGEGKTPGDAPSGSGAVRVTDIDRGVSVRLYAEVAARPRGKM